MDFNLKPSGDIMRFLTIVFALVCMQAQAADNIVIPGGPGGQTGKAYLMNNDDSLIPLQACMTTDGASNLIPVLGAGGEVIASQGTSPWEVKDSRLSTNSDGLRVSVPTTGRTSLGFVRNDYSSVNVTTAAYVQLVASTADVINEIVLYDSSGQTMKLAVGGAGSEVDVLVIPPGGSGNVSLNIPAGSRISVRAISGTASTGEIDLTFLK